MSTYVDALRYAASAYDGRSDLREMCGIAADEMERLETLCARFEAEIDRLSNAIYMNGDPEDGYYGKCVFCKRRIEEVGVGRVERHADDCVWLAEHKRRTDDDTRIVGDVLSPDSDLGGTP